MNQTIDTDAQLVAAVAEHDPALAHAVQLRLRALRLRLVVAAPADPDFELTGPRHSVWQSLHWPWRQRG